MKAKLHLAKLKPEGWQQKHKKAESKQKSGGSHSPSPVNFSPFERIQKKKGNIPGKSKLWGSEPRFFSEKKKGEED